MSVEYGCIVYNSLAADAYTFFLLLQQLFVVLRENFGAWGGDWFQDTRSSSVLVCCVTLS